MKAILAVILTLAFWQVADARDFRDFTNASGVTVHAELLDFDKDKDEWHELVIRTKDATIAVLVDGDEVGELESEGIAHTTKSRVSLTTNINDVHYDDFVVKAAPASANEDSSADKDGE